MNTYIENHPVFGDTLFAEAGKIKIGIALKFGIRISHLSYENGENLFFEQPDSMTDLSTPDGWRVRGGHRLWIAPEGREVYYPDNEPISYEISDGGILVTQKIDPWLDIQKSIAISFDADNSVKLVHKIKNTSSRVRSCALWGITSLAPGGTEYIRMDVRDGGYDPYHKITLWDYTSLGDERASYERDLITLKHSPTGKKYKIGLAHPKGSIKYINKGVVFEKVYDISSEKLYPDGNVSFETFMCDPMVEIESLSPLCDIKPGECCHHTEIWRLNKSI